MPTQRSLCSTAIGAVLLLLPALAAPETTEEGLRIFEWPASRTYDIAVQGALAYVGSEHGFQVIDVSDPEAPRKLGGIDLPDARLTVVAASRTHVLAGDRTADSLLVIDVTDQTAPRIVSRLDDWNTINDIAIEGDNAFVVDYSGMTVVDISDPANPSRIASPQSASAHHIVVAEGTAYLSHTESGLRIVDVSDPSKPVSAGSHLGGRRRGAAGVDVDGDVAYLVYQGGLKIVDVSDKQLPVGLGFAPDLMADPGGLGYVKMSGGIACVLGEDGLSFVDVSDPNAPGEVGFFRVSIDRGFFSDLGAGLEVSGATAFITGLVNGPIIVDFSDPSAPREVSRLRDSFGLARDVAVAGHKAYVGTTTDFLAVNLRGEAPWLLGSINLPGEAHDVEVSGGYAYVTVDWVGLQVIDIRGPTKPQVVGGFYIAREGMHVAVDGSLACVVDSSRALVAEISDPENPVLTAVLDVPAVDAALQGDTLVLMTTEIDAEGDEYTTLRTFDLTDPRQPVALGTLDFRRRARLGLAGARAYVVDGRGLHVVDLTDPGRPAEVASSRPGGSSAPIVVSDTMVCQTVGLQFLKIKVLILTPDPATHCFDVSDPSRPLPTGRIYPGTIRAVSNEYLVGTTDTSLWVAAADELKTRWLGGVGIDPGRTTHLVMLNTWPVETEVAVSIVTPHGALEGTTVIPARGQLTADLSGMSGAEEAGLIRIQPTLPILANGQIASTTRTNGTGRIAIARPDWHKVGRGWFGIDPAEERLVEGWDSGIGWLVGLRQLEGRFSTDLVLSNPDEDSGPDSVEIRLYATDGTELGAYTESVDGGLTVVDPAPLARRAGRPDLGWGYARITGRILASAFVRDLRTGDIATVPMVRDPGAGGDERALRPQWLEIVAHIDGSSDSSWRTDLVVLNLAEEAAGVELRLHGPDGVSSTTNPVDGSSQAIFQDVVGLLGSHSKGMLEIRSDRPVVVSGRMYSTRDGGTVGHALNGRDAFGGLISGETVWLPGLRQERTRYRTNINVSNAGDTPAEVRVELFDEIGTELDEFTLSVPPKRVIQDIEPFARRGGRPDLGWGYARVTAEQGTGVFVSASVIDCRNNDSISIAMQR